MATTQQPEKPTNGNGKAVVVGLRPLNLNTAKPRVRRTSDQVVASRILKQTNLAEKAANRAKLLAQRQARAAERAQAALEEATRLEEAAKQKQLEAEQRAAQQVAERESISRGEMPRKASSTVNVIEKTPDIEAKIENIEKDFTKFFGYLRDTYDVEFSFGSDGTPELVKRGYISIKARGYLAPMKKDVTAVASSDTGVAREAVRFMQFYKEVGLTPAWLNKEVQLRDDDATYTVSGLRGKAHAIVLRRKDTGQAFTMTATDFKKSLREEYAIE